MAERQLDQELQALADRLINTDDVLEYIKHSDARIAVLTEDTEKKSQGRVIFGQCEKVPSKFRWSVPYDFTITIFLPNVERFSNEQMEILMLHELLHVGVEIDGNEERYWIRPHDYEEFAKIIERYGLDWSVEG